MPTFLFPSTAATNTMIKSTVKKERSNRGFQLTVAGTRSRSFRGILCTGSPPKQCLASSFCTSQDHLPRERCHPQSERLLYQLTIKTTARRHTHRRVIIPSGDSSNGQGWVKYTQFMLTRSPTESRQFFYRASLPQTTLHLRQADKTTTHNQHFIL